MSKLAPILAAVLATGAAADAPRPATVPMGERVFLVGEMP